MRLEDLETSCKDLPIFPAVARKVLETLKRETFSADELSEVLSADIALTTKMLRMANSAFYERTTPVNTVKDAFMVIGSERAKHLAVAYNLKKALTTDFTGFDFKRFWKNSLTTALASKHLAKIVDTYKVHEYFLLGFLMDIGVLILYRHDPDAYRQILEEKKKTGQKLYCIERPIFGVDHQDAAGYLLRIWNFPESIYLPISRHHNQEILKDTEQATTGDYILRASDLIRDIYYGYGGDEDIVNLYSMCSERFSLDPEDIDGLVDTAGIETRKTVEFFDIEPSDIRPYIDVLRDANKRLMEKLQKGITGVKEAESIRSLVQINERLCKALKEEASEN